MATAAIKPSAEAACRLRRGGAVKTEGQWLIAKKYGQQGLLYSSVCVEQECVGDNILLLYPLGGDICVYAL